MTTTTLGPAPEPAANPLHVPHSRQFAGAWRDLVTRQFRLPPSGPFVRVPSWLPGGAVLSYLPFLNYTDINRGQAADLIERAGSHRYLIRVLDPAEDEPAINAPVAVRLHLDGRTEEALLTRAIKPACRRKLKQAWRAGFRVEEGVDAGLALRVHRFLADTLQKRHGVPALPAHFFAALSDDPAFDARFIGLSLDGGMVAAMVVIFDGALAWVPWMAADPARFPQSPNHLLYWRAIAAAVGRRCSVLDFGRSPYGNPTYRFKSQWGCQPVRIALLAPKPVDLYAKYEWASRAWKHLPGWLARPAGGWLTRYLADL